jgi:hypothetical protein
MTRAVGDDEATIGSLDEVASLFDQAQTSVFKLMASVRSILRLLSRLTRRGFGAQVPARAQVRGGAARAQPRRALGRAVRRIGCRQVPRPSRNHLVFACLRHLEVFIDPNKDDDFFHAATKRSGPIARWVDRNFGIVKFCQSWSFFAGRARSRPGSRTSEDNVRTCVNVSRQRGDWFLYRFRPNDFLLPSFPLYLLALRALLWKRGTSEQRGLFCFHNTFLGTSVHGSMKWHSEHS